MYYIMSMSPGKEPSRVPFTELTTSISINDVEYLVHTEELGEKTTKAVSMIYMNGQIVFKKEAAYDRLVGMEDYREKLDLLLRALHKKTIDEFTEQAINSGKTKTDFFDEAKRQLRDGDKHNALKTLKAGLQKFPGDPYLMSYYGCLLAVVGKQSADGVRICREALERLKKSLPFGSEVFHPAFYLNLGRACVANGQKREGADAFRAGLRIDPDDKDLLDEIERVGDRRKPPLPFLHRTNPINKYIGKLTRGT